MAAALKRLLATAMPKPGASTKFTKAPVVPWLGLRASGVSERHLARGTEPGERRRASEMAPYGDRLSPFEWNRDKLAINHGLVG